MPPWSTRPASLPCPDAGSGMDTSVNSGRTRVVLDRPLDPFQQLSAAQRRRLLVRVLCELVAYDDPALSPPERLAG